MEIASSLRSRNDSRHGWHFAASGSLSGAPANDPEQARPPRSPTVLIWSPAAAHAKHSGLTEGHTQSTARLSGYLLRGHASRHLLAWCLGPCRWRAMDDTASTTSIIEPARWISSMMGPRTVLSSH